MSATDAEVVAALARRWFVASKALEQAVADLKEERAARERAEAATARVRCDFCDPSYGCFLDPAACSKLVGPLAALRYQHHMLLQFARSASSLICALLEFRSHDAGCAECSADRMCDEKRHTIGPAATAAMGGAADWILAGLHDLPELAEAREALIRAGWTRESTQETVDLTPAGPDEAGE